ncbi:TonB-dependent receptor plug domain-containing protein [Xanthomonas oryzae]|uniref:TonB-dependent receptor plug domain-containing protein n=1 Tax=Xanthomonas oryzae TaxID=347 RepID=UPI00211AC798|nr:TonB-dependent receptor plug domain-containing protein [Xanthomonas oryzae]
MSRSVPALTILTLALAAIVDAPHAAVQDVPIADRQATDLDAVVVSGTPKGRARKDAPFAISVLSEQTLQRSAPTSSVDMLRAVPGISAEPSGGQGGGQNLHVRGLPAGGWFYMQYQEDGMTLFDEPQESFLNSDTLVFAGHDARAPGSGPRRHVAAVRYECARWNRQRDHPPWHRHAGGRAAVDQRQNGQWREDAYSAGPLSDNVLYSIGGFHRSDDGLRRTGFTADRGGQLRGTLTFLLGDAVLDVDAKLLNDRTAFYNPT